MQVHWWTPHGQVTDNQPQLQITDITEQHEGLYICVSGLQGEHISVFDLKVYTKASDHRPRREAPIIHIEQDNTNMPRNNPLVRQGTRTQSEFVLAVCLSVFITFIVAFILGVLLRPLLDKLWRRIRSKRQSGSSPTTSRASSTGPQPYVNEGYSDAGDQERVVRVGSRVTFGEITEVGDQGSNVPYYVTVEDVHSDGSSESNTEVENVYEKHTEKHEQSKWREQALEMDHHRGRANSISSSSTQEGEVLVTNNKTLAPNSNTVLEFEPIPDGDVSQPKRKSSTSSSSSSSSSHSGQTLNGNVSGEVRESIEQSVDPPAVTVSVTKTTTEDPFSGFPENSRWPASLTEQNVDDLDTEFWNDSGESFSFNEESERDLSSSALGHSVDDEDTWRQGNIESPTYKLNSDVIGVDIPFGKEVSVDDVKQRDTLSSSSSSESDDSEGPNSYTVNPELQKESEILKESYKKTDSDWTPEDATFDDKSQPGAGIFIRQETITLDPSDIHLTFTREESVDEGMHIDDSWKITEGLFGSWTDVSVDAVSKVKRYVQFKQSKPQSSSLPSLSPSSTKKNVTPGIEMKTEPKVESSAGEASCLTQVKVSVEEIPKVKRYIHFKQSEPHAPTLQAPPSSINKDVRVEARRSSTSSSSEDEGQLTFEEEKLFRKTGVSSDGLPKVKRYITFKQFEPSSPNLSVSSPSPKIPLTDQRNPSNFSPEGLPLYQVHPTYRINQSTINRDHDTDRSSSESSSEEDQFLEFPRKLEIKTEPEITRELVTSDKNTVLNIDFDNSSSSTDVFEKKQLKGLARLKLLGNRFFNRRENEPGSTGEALDLSYKTHGKLPEDTVQQSSNEDSFFADIGLSFDQLTRPTKSLAFTISDPQSPDQLPPSSPNKKVNTNEKRAEFESRRSSSSSSSEEGSISSQHEEHIILRKSLSDDHLPKVKRYLQFSHSAPHSKAQLPSPPSTTGVVTPDLIAKTESRRSSSSSEDDVKQTTEGENLHGLPKVKRYIEFSRTEPPSTTHQVNKQSIPPKVVAPLVSRRSSSSSSSEDVVEKSSSTTLKSNVKSDPNEDHFFGQIGVHLDTVPKVRQYIEFTQFKPPSSNRPSLPPSSTKKIVTPEIEVKTEAKVGSSLKEASYLTQPKVEEIPKVKRYIQFKQSEPQSPTLTPSPPSVNKAVVVEARRSSTSSSEDEGKLTPVQEASNSDRVSKVKRYIAFKQLEPTSPTLSVSSSSTKTEATTGAVIQSSQSSSSSEDEVSPTPKEKPVFGQTGVSLDRLPQVKRHLQFKQHVPQLSVVPPTDILNTLHVTSENKTKAELRKLSTSSEDDDILTAQDDIFFGQTGASLDKIPTVKRYIHFTQPESQFPPPSTTSQSVSKSVVVQETRKSSTSSEDEVDVKLSTNKDSTTGKTGEFFVKIPEVKRYVKFTQSEDSLGLPPVTSIKVTETKLAKIDVQPATSESKRESRRLSTSSEDDVTITGKEGNFREQTGIYLDRIPKVRRYIHFTQPEQQFSVQSSTFQSVAISGRIQETRRSSTSSEEDVRPFAKDGDMSYRQIGASFSQPPKVKSYIEEHDKSSVEDVKLNTTLNRLSMTSIKTYSTPKAKADVETRWSSSSSEASPSCSMKKGSASLRSEIHYKDNMTTKQYIVEQTGLKPELKKSGYFSSDSSDPPAVPQTPPPSYLKHEDAREYLRDNSEVRQRQERRRLLQQRKKAMDELGITSLSPITQEGNRQDGGSRVDYGGRAHSSVSTANTVTYRRTEVAEVPVLQGLKTKNISPHISKSPEDSDNTKYKEFLI